MSLWRVTAGPAVRPAVRPAVLPLVVLAVLACAGCSSATPEERAAVGTVRALAELNDELSATGAQVRLADFAVLADEPYASTAAVNRLVFRENGLRQSGRTQVDVSDVSAVGGLGVVVACLRLDDVEVTQAESEATDGPSEGPGPGGTTAVPLRYSLTQRGGAWYVTAAEPVALDGCGTTEGTDAG